MTMPSNAHVTTHGVSQANRKTLDSLIKSNDAYHLEKVDPLKLAYRWIKGLYLRMEDDDIDDEEELPSSTQFRNVTPRSSQYPKARVILPKRSNIILVHSHYMREVYPKKWRRMVSSWWRNSLWSSCNISKVIVVGTKLGMLVPWIHKNKHYHTIMLFELDPIHMENSEEFN